jgi:hypothetical protein
LPNPEKEEKLFENSNDYCITGNRRSLLNEVKDLTLLLKGMNLLKGGVNNNFYCGTGNFFGIQSNMNGL